MLYSFCSIACIYFLWVFTHIHSWVLQTDGFYLLQSCRLSVFLVFPHTEGLRHKSWWVLPAVPLIQLWLYFSMPSWSAAVPRTSTFPPPFPATLCLMLDSLKRVAVLFSLSSSLLLQMKWCSTVLWHLPCGPYKELIFHFDFSRLPGFKWSTKSCLGELCLQALCYFVIF